MTTTQVLGPEFAAEVEALLDHLGATPTQVGEFLTTQGVTGVPEDPCYCVLATYLRQCGYDVDEVDTGAARVAFGGVQFEGRPHFPAPALVPAPVRRFLLSFDRGEWPELVRAEVPA